MDSVYNADWLLAVLVSQGFSDSYLLPPSPNGTLWAGGQLAVEKQLVHLHIGLPFNFPSALPLARLVPWDSVGMVPHVNAENGMVCYQDSEGLLLNKDMAAELVGWAVDQAVNELERGVRGENRTDFTEEFEASWMQLTSRATLRNVMDVPSEPKELSIIWRKGTEGYLAESLGQVEALLQVRSVGTYKVQRVVFLPLPVGSYIEPPRPDRPFWTAADFRRWVAPALEALTPDQEQMLLKNSKSKSGIVVLALQRPSQGVALFAVKYQSPTGQHPLLPRSEAKLWPVQVVRWEPSYLVPRGGGNVSLRHKQVLLVGCGAVGGHIAFDLIRCGVLRLTLVDFDDHKMENTFRHVLGMARKPAAKADALRRELLAKYPYVQVVAISMGIETARRNGLVKWEDYDLVVAATGNPTTELWLNEQMHQQLGSPPALFTWLEAYGIGGHALLTRPGSVGCLQCLYTTPDQNQLLNRAAFAKEGQLFSMSLAGCSARHTPYGSLDATRTAEIAVRLAVRMLVGREQSAPLISWKGDAEDFTAAGFTLSDRFDVSEERLFKNRYGYVASTCPVCSVNAVANAA